MQRGEVLDQVFDLGGDVVGVGLSEERCQVLGQGRLLEVWVCVVQVGLHELEHVGKLLSVLG